MRKKQTLIQLKDIKKTFDLGKVKVHAVCGVDFIARKGEFMSIMGPSGSGKSTLMHIIGCLERATSGTYMLEGQNVNKLNEAELARVRREKIGFVFQTFNLLPQYTAFRNVEIPLIYKGMAKKDREHRVREILTNVGLAQRIEHRPNELSGGERQRVAVARALANNPQILLADEPTGNLDSKSGASILNLLEELNEKENVTVVVVTHDEKIARFTNRIVMLKDGKVQKKKRTRKKK